MTLNQAELIRQSQEDKSRDDCGVIYMLQGHKHACVLAVSLMTLRRWWKGPVCLIAGDEKAERIAERLVQDERLNLTLKTWTAHTGQRGLGYANKTHMAELSPFGRTIFLDADTAVAGELEPLWPKHGGEVRLTQFADWWTTGRRIGGRIESWREFAPVQVSRMLGAKYPAINTGVMSFSRKSTEFMAAWREMTLRNVSFICDEIAAQLVFPEHPHRVLPDRFNWSPMYSSSPLEKASIIHFHGKKHIRKEAGRRVWWPLFLCAWRENIGGLREWAPAGDKSLKAHFEAHGRPE